MLLEIFIALLIGILAGTITGLFPGIHINLVALMLFIYSSWLLGFTSPIILAVFIVAMSITHVFLDFIPSIFLGAPEEATALSVLPGHSLLMEGRGYEAVRLTALGGFVGLVLLILLTPLFIWLLPSTYGHIDRYMPYVLVLASSFLIIKEGRGMKLMAMMIFLLSGLLGVFTLDFHMIKEPLFPLLTGLFGTSMMLMSIRSKAKIPKQTTKVRPLEKGSLLKSSLSGIISAPLCAFLPGLGASQAAVLGSSVFKEDRRSFLVLLGIIGTLVSGLNFVALYAINKPRSGTAVIVGKLISLDMNSLLVLVAAMLVSGSIALLLSLFFAKMFAVKMPSMDYRKMNMLVIALLFVLSIVVSGPYSLLVLIAATSLGILCIELGVKKMHLMGCLILPVIFYLIF